MPQADTQFKKGNPGGPGRPKGTPVSTALHKILGAKSAVLELRIEDGGKERTKRIKVSTDDRSTLNHAVAMVLLGRHWLATCEPEGNCRPDRRQSSAVCRGRHRPKNPLEEMSEAELQREIDRLQKIESQKDLTSEQARKQEAE